MGGILELIKLIYGSKALSKVLGTRTNVIRLPDNELKQYTKQELNIEAASNKLAQKVNESYRKSRTEKSTNYFNGQPRISHQAARSEWRGSI
jgi:hypothetical protein